MTQLSDRYLLGVFAMLLVAAVPVTAHYIVGIETQECENPDELKRLTIGGASDVAEWPSHHSYAVSQFTRGEVQGARFVWVRSSVPQPFYGTRPFYTPGRYTDGPSELEHVAVGADEIPVRVWQRRVLNNVEITAILRIYRGRAVDDVLVPSLRHFTDTLLHGPSPVNFVGITGAGHFSNRAAIRRGLIGWLVNAWAHYLHACEPLRYPAGK